MRIFGQPRRFGEPFGLQAGGSTTYAAYMAIINPLFWGKFNEASGSLINYGSVGSALNGAVSGTVTYAQTGLLGASQAYLFPSTDGTAVLTNHASVQGMTNFTLWFVAYANGAGGVSTGTLMDKASSLYVRLGGASRTVDAVVYHSTTPAQSITSNTLSLSTWYTLGVTYTGSDKKVRIYINGIEASYGTQNAGVGTRISNTNAIYLANHAPLARYWNGYIDEVFIKDSVLDASTLLPLDTLARA